MKIDDLQINGFGKLSNKKIKLDKKINIIYGKNEAGKSTLLGFIKSIFYGASKNKNGKEISDFDKYTPWKGESYSGKISYELDNGEVYEIFRDFRKKNPIIYNSNKQDISLSFPIDKTKGIDFIYNQINLDEDTFNNTIIIAQNDIKVSKSAQNGIIQKISNIISSGDENVSYKKTLDKINKSQLENIGTDRTKEKPINIVKDKIDKLKNLKSKIENYKEFLNENDCEVRKIEEKIDEEETKLLLYRIIKENNQKSKIKKSEIEVITNIRDEDIKKIEKLDEKIDNDLKPEFKNGKKLLIVTNILMLIFLISSIICFFLKLKKIISISLLGLAILIFIVDIVSRIIFNKNKKLKLNELEELEKNIESEINILRDNVRSRQSEIDIKQNEIKQAENEINRLVMNDFENKLDSDFIEEAFELNEVELENKIAEKNDVINGLKIEKGAKQGQKELMQEEINELPKVQEELERLEDEKKDLELLNNSYNIAKEGLESAYENIKNSLSPEFTSNLCKIASKVSGGKYKEINLVDNDGLIVETEDGRFIPVERLSQGTIDQMYLGLRLASIDTISNEKMPIILDEAFAFFDDERLKNILEFLNYNYNDKQIILFTCSKREVEILDKLNIDYNYIKLEN